MIQGLIYPVGIIGVGNMGAAIAANLMSHGWPVHVCDIDAGKTQVLAQLGAVVHAHPAEMASEVSLLIVCVVDGVQTQEVLFVALSERMGLDLTTTLNVIEQSSGQSWIGSDRMRRAIADDFEPRAHTTLPAKDTKLAVAAASKLGFKTPLGQLTANTFARALEHGLAEQDDASLIKLMRDDN